MKVVIYGAGEVGTHLTKLLSYENHDVILLDEDEEQLNEIESHFDILTIVGSGTSIEDLRKAQVAYSDLFIAVPPYEEASLLSAMLADKLGAKKTFARINNFEYLSSENRQYFKQMGVDELIFPEKLGAQEIVQSLKHVGIRQMFDFGQNSLYLFAIKIRENAPIINKKLTEISAQHKENNYFIVAIVRNGKTIIPHGNETIKHNDLAYITLTPNGYKQVLHDTGKTSYEVKNVIILGGSRIGIKVAQDIEQNYNVKIVEINKEKSNHLAEILENTLIINGDGRDLELLKEEGITKTDAFIAVTGNSEINILACQLAKKMGVPKTVAEVENMDYIDLAENIGIGTIINKKLIAVEHIYRYTLKAQVSNVKCLTTTDADVLELIARENSKITKTNIDKLNLPEDVNIGGVIRAGKAFIPTGGTQIMANDKVVIFVTPTGVKKIEKLFS